MSFRLDSFNGTASSIAITNVTTGFAGVEQPFALAVVGSTNRTPTLKLTGATNFNYLLQSSTNLVDWTPSALLLNTNGTVLFTDISATNSAQRFYRALNMGGTSYQPVPVRLPAGRNGERVIGLNRH